VNLQETLDSLSVDARRRLALSPGGEGSQLQPGTGVAVWRELYGLGLVTASRHLTARGDIIRDRIIADALNAYVEMLGGGR
jgi:hypothetical protein